MASPSSTDRKSLRSRFRSRFLPSLRTKHNALGNSTSKTSTEPPAEHAAATTASSSSLPNAASLRASDTNAVYPLKTPISEHHHDSLQISPKRDPADTLKLQAKGQSARQDSLVFKDDSKDIWSTAFREAVSSLGEDIDVAILQGKSIKQVLEQLEEMDKDASQESIFLRGVNFLRQIQVPLESFKLALDLAAPLASFDPTAKTVFGVVTGVTAIAISLASANFQFAKQIEEMLKHLSYIDECDTLGRRSNKQSIHEVLVSVYKKLLEFYQASSEILARRGVKLVVKIALENNRLPDIVEEFLKCAELLHKVVQQATNEIVHDIQVMLYDREIARWLGGDKSQMQNEHHANLADLRADTAYVPLLAVLGDTGSGKSVTASFVIDELRRRRTSCVPRPMVSYHYCRDDGTGNITYILSVLILSLLEQLPGLKKTFYDWYKQNQMSGILEPGKDARNLGEFFRTTLASLDRPLFLVIDGLDECDRNSRNHLFELTKYSAQLDSNIKFLLFSRPNKELHQYLNENAQLDLACNPDRDRIIVRSTVERELGYLSSDVKELVVDRLSSLAMGSGIWTNMVVALLARRQIQARTTMRRFLDDVPLPSNLAELFDTILKRSTMEDKENECLARAALMVLAASSRPLNTAELAWAATLSTNTSHVSSVIALAEYVDEERVVALVRPFIFLIRSDGNEHSTVRLLHQSIKDWLVQNAATHWPSLHLTDRHIALSAPQASGGPEALEAHMLKICIDYLMLDEIDMIEFFSEQQLAIEVLPQEVDLFTDNDDAKFYDVTVSWEEWEKSMIRYNPVERGFGELFVYASCHWLDHLRISCDGTNIPELRTVQDVCAAGSTRLHNWTQQNCRPGCVIQARFDFDSKLYDPLGIASLYASETMLRNMVLYSDFTRSTFLPNSAIAAIEQIIRWGDLARLSIIVKADRSALPLSCGDFWRLVLRHWSDARQHQRDWESVFVLVDHMTDALINERCANEVLCIAAKAGCLPLVQRLIYKANLCDEFRNNLLSLRHGLGSADHINSRPQCIGEAVLGNHVDILILLLEQDGIGPLLNHIQPNGETILHLASVHCNPTVFQLLVPHFQRERNQTDKNGRSAVTRVILSSADLDDRIESARILLLADSYVETGKDGLAPLCVAVQIGDLAMCSLLVHVGRADPLSALVHDSPSRMVLRYQTPTNQDHRSRILQLLKTCVESPQKS